MTLCVYMPGLPEKPASHSALRPMKTSCYECQKTFEEEPLFYNCAFFLNDLELGLASFFFFLFGKGQVAIKYRLCSSRGLHSHCSALLS